VLREDTTRSIIPFRLAVQTAQETGKLFRVGQYQSWAGTAELFTPIETFQSGEELAAKNAAQHFHRQKEGIARMYPVVVIRGQTSGRDHAMDMRMQEEVLAPSVQNADHADLRAEVLGIPGNLNRRGGRMVKKLKPSAAQ